MEVPQDVKNNLAEWKLKYERLIILDNKWDNETYILRPPTAREYELLTECIGNPALSYIPPAIAYRCILYPYTAIGSLDEVCINHIITNLQDRAGFNNEPYLTEVVTKERNSYDPRNADGNLRHYRALLSVNGGVPWSEVNEMNFDQLVKRIVAAEIATNKVILQLPGHDNRGRKIEEKKGKGKWQDGVPRA